jgi:hypothetical protein
MISPGSQKSKGLSRRMLVTLISSRRTPKGIVLCADSQETCGHYRAPVEKIAPRNVGNFRMVVAGSGPGPLIESFIVKLERRLSLSSATTLPEFVIEVEQELQDFYDTDVRLYPGAEDDKWIKMFVGALSTVTRDYDLWVQEGIRLRPSLNPELIGWDENLYKAVDKRFHSDSMSVPQAILACLYVLGVDEETSNYVKGPLSLLVIDPSGFYVAKDEYIADMATRLKLLERQTTKMFLDCADTTVSLPDLEDSIEAFKQASLEAHRKHIDEQAGKTSLEELIKDGPLRRIPAGPIRLGATGVGIEHDRKTRDELNANFRVLRDASRERGYSKTMTCVHCKKDFDFGGDLDPGATVLCENCKRPNQIPKAKRKKKEQK